MDQQDKALFKNQRKHTRFVRDDIKVSIIPFSLLSKKKPIECKLIDICATGVQISTKEKLKTNTNLTLYLQFKSDQKFKLKAKIIRKNDIKHHYSDHHFKIFEGFLRKKDNPLISVHLFDSDNKIEAKYRFLDMRCLRILTSSPLDQNKHYDLVFRLKNGEETKISSQITHYQCKTCHDYGLKFDQTNDTLAEHILKTQTDLIFK